MNEKNGIEVPQENAIPEEESLQNDMATPEGQASESGPSDEPAADSETPDESVPDEAVLNEGASKQMSDDKADGASVSQDEASALLNQEEMEAGISQKLEGEEGSSGLLSQVDIDNALQQADAEGDEDADSGSREDIDAAINGAVDDLDPDEFGDSRKPSVKEADFQQLSSAHKGDAPRNINLLMDVQLPVSIELGRTKMDISDILSLGPGSVVELEKLVGEPVDLLVNQKCVARGEVVVVEENFGLRITQLISPEERIKNLQ